MDDSYTRYEISTIFRAAGVSRVPSKRMIIQLHSEGILPRRRSGRLNAFLESWKVDKNFYWNLFADECRSHVDKQVCEYANGK